MDRVGHRWTEIKESKPNDLIYGSMSDSGEGRLSREGRLDGSPLETLHHRTDYRRGGKREEDR